MESVIQLDNSNGNKFAGICYGNRFFDETQEHLNGLGSRVESYCMMAIEIEHFRLFNRIQGREVGDYVLHEIAHLLNKYVEVHGGVAGYLGGDNFGLFTIRDENELERLSEDIHNIIQKWSGVLEFLPAFGVYPVVSTETTTAAMYDGATVALTQVLGSYGKRVCIFQPDMVDKIEDELRILSDVQKGIEKDEFTFFIQPQCNIENGKIVGGEALIRWLHSEKGMISPGKFIPVLERNGFIAVVDLFVWEKVCKWLRACIDDGYDPVPVSVNVSRIDILTMDVETHLIGLVEQYQLNPKLLKVEITESAYAEDEDKIVKAVNALRKYGFLVMMDDFGSGYSSLNMLKSVPVDVLKMDMRFLDIKGEDEEVGVGIMESIVNMARQMRIPVVVEGVETEQQEQFIAKMGCRYTQGYYYYRPMPIDDFMNILADENNLSYESFWCKQTEAVRISEFFDENLMDDEMANNILGPVAFYDVYDNKIEVTRLNEHYMKLANISAQDEERHKKRFWAHVRDDDRRLLHLIFEQAYENQKEGAQGYIHFLRSDGKTLWVNIKIFYLREKDGHKFFYGALTDMTTFIDENSGKDSVGMAVQKLPEEQLNTLDAYYGNLPQGYVLTKVELDEDGNPGGFDLLYVNKEIRRLSGDDEERLEHLVNYILEDNVEMLLNNAYKAAYLKETTECQIYTKISARYFRVTMYYYQYGYCNCVLEDVTNEHISEKALTNVLSAFREAYMVQLQDNYCRMIYPDNENLDERGVYDEVVNRHFVTGKILPVDEKNVRRFLSLEYLNEALAKQDVAEYKYQRSVRDIGEEWCLATFMVSERNEDGTPKTAVLTIRSIETIMREQQANRQENMVKMLANMSEGFFIYSAENEEKILYANQPTLELFGCKNIHEFRELTGGTFMGMVHEEDRKRVQWEIKEQVQFSETNMDFIRYRITTKDGEIRWLDDCGHLEEGTVGAGNIFYVFISDITETLPEHQKNRLLRLSRKYNEKLG